ncbi:YcxB family protein [Parvicella tangerina]|uniref:YcxB-like C-terminal domain-containing protein n=1 Tax=Parvicella tangerina TaxID=2829795 RepID=A0A916NHK1_9FLAO|nr:YcxB family protein [Parvicella tangerina]CAG5081625.1 hypothetical protein CRYO30217_01687 [Parvicella tangerina]
MKISYQIKEEDYLTHQLYTASKTKKIRRKRIVFWLIVPVAYASAGYLSYFQFRQHNVGLVMFGLAIFWLLFYPFYSRWNYKRHYRNHIQKHLKGQFDQVVSLELGDNRLIIQDAKGNNSNIKYVSVKEIVELPDHFLIRMQTNSSIIFPKREFKDIKELQKFLGLIVTRHKVSFRKDVKWKWR